MMMIINKARYIFIILFFALLLLFIYHFGYDINSVGHGDFIYETMSPTQEYVLKAYLIKGGSLNDNSIRVELVDLKKIKVKIYITNITKKRLL